MNKFLNYFKSFTLNNNNHKFKLKDKVFFSTTLIHPFDNSAITYGIITKIDKLFKPDKITIYLADAMQYKSYCSSYSKEFSIKELSQLTKI